jgi:hypothetical protein
MVRLHHALGSQHYDKCGHGRCKCLVDPGRGYCCDTCERADIEVERNRHDADSACACGHADCEQMQSSKLEQSRPIYVR